MNRTTATPLVGKLDWISVSLVLFLVVFGWLNILATVTPVADSFQWSWNNEAGKQLSFMRDIEALEEKLVAMSKSPNRLLQE